MAQTDYILRMIEQMGQMLVQLRNAILGRGATAEVIADRLAAAASEGGFDLSLARAASPETIQMLVAPAGDLEPGRGWLVAEILYLDGLQAQLEDRLEDAEASFRKSLPLYTLLEPKGLFLGLPEAAARISEIEARLATLAEQPARPDEHPS
jgi:signal transduction histidine kinase